MVEGVAVRVLVAGSLLKESRHAEAIKAYKQALRIDDTNLQILREWVSGYEITNIDFATQ